MPNGIPGEPTARRRGSRGTSCRVTPRSSAIRLMMRVVAGEQAGAVVAPAELGRDRVADGLAGEAVGDELLRGRSRPRCRPARSLTATTISRPLSLPLSPMPLPPFSNILTAYSSMSPYGWNVGTVATTTTSPLAAWSARMRRSSSRRARGVDDVREVVDRRRSVPAAPAARAARRGSQDERDEPDRQGEPLAHARARHVSTYSQTRSAASM